MGLCTTTSYHQHLPFSSMPCTHTHTHTHAYTHPSFQIPRTFLFFLFFLWLGSRVILSLVLITSLFFFFLVVPVPTYFYITPPFWLSVRCLPLFFWFAERKHLQLAGFDSDRRLPSLVIYVGSQILHTRLSTAKETPSAS